MNITKKYWLWDEMLNDTDFKLGRPIEVLVAQKTAVKTKENAYAGQNGIPWRVVTKNGFIQSIFYLEEFPPFSADFNLSFGILEFEKYVNAKLTPIPEPEAKDIFFVIFRDFLVAMAGISRNDIDGK